jgi:N-acylneuraminate cytidylyltransferase
MAIRNLPKKTLWFFLSDFDGVLTDNSVYLNRFGQEFVKCSRADGLGIQMLKNANQLGIVNLEMGILSTEKNRVVKARAKKLGLKCYYGIDSKYNFLKNEYFPNFNLTAAEGFKKLIYLGNDINDLNVIKHAKVSIVPGDSHPLIQQNASFVIDSKFGGNGFVREVIERLLGPKNLKLLYESIDSNP